MNGRQRVVLDAYCGAGGAARGYQQAGFYVIGVDEVEQPRYAGDEFWRGSALDFIALHGDEVDLTHGSPPCQAGCALTTGSNAARNTAAGKKHPQLIPATRLLLEHQLREAGVPYVIENVAGAPIRKDVRLCGEMFGLAVIRHRFFELGGWQVAQPQHLPHRGRVVGYRHGQWFDGPYFAVYGEGGGKGSVAQWQAAMDMHWTDVRVELSEAIPPAYTRWLGEEAMWLFADPAPEEVMAA